MALTGMYTFAERGVGTFAGLGVSWSVAPSSDVDQVAAEIFCKWQMAERLALTPSIQVLWNPAFNPVDDVVTVLGVRLRVAL